LCLSVGVLTRKRVGRQGFVVSLRTWTTQFTSPRRPAGSETYPACFSVTIEHFRRAWR